MSARSGHMTLVLLVAALVSACGPSVWVDSVRTGPERPSRPDDAPLPVYFNESPATPYAEVGQIRVRSSGDGATVESVLGAATSQAKKLGADAIIVDFRRDYDSVVVTLDCEGRPSVPTAPRLNARVVAVRFVSPGEAATEAPPSGRAPVRDCPVR